MIDQELQQLDAFKNKLIAWLAESGVALLVAILIIALGVWLSKSLASKTCSTSPSGGQAKFFLAMWFSLDVALLGPNFMQKIRKK